jgi:hypothetical protein
VALMPGTSRRAEVAAASEDKLAMSTTPSRTVIDASALDSF